MNKLSNEIRELTDANAALSDEELELTVGGQGPTTATKGKTNPFSQFLGPLVSVGRTAAATAAPGGSLQAQ